MAYTEFSACLIRDWYGCVMFDSQLGVQTRGKDLGLFNLRKWSPFNTSWPAKSEPKRDSVKPISAGIWKYMGRE